MSDNRTSDWIQTYTGRAFYPFEPHASDVCIEDIAHSLSLQCRFAGHCREFYSVAEHCVRASELPVAHESPFSILLHDATEAYLVDLPRPLKQDRAFAAYRHLESDIARVIEIAFGIPRNSPDHPLVHIADEIMLATEARDLMGTSPGDWHLNAEPDAERIKPWDCKQAERQFLARFNGLTLPREPK